MHDYVSVLTALSDLRFEVRNYKSNANNTQWSWSCDVCGDSKTDPRKARFNVTRKGNDFVCHCYNCGYSAPFTQYLAGYHPDKYTRVSVETFTATAPTMFDVNGLVETLEPSMLHHLFYISKRQNAKQWLALLAEKKVNLKENNIRRLYNIHREYWREHGN